MPNHPKKMQGLLLTILPITPTNIKIGNKIFGQNPEVGSTSVFIIMVSTVDTITIIIMSKYLRLLPLSIAPPRQLISALAVMIGPVISSLSCVHRG